MYLDKITNIWHIINKRVNCFDMFKLYLKWSKSRWLSIMINLAPIILHNSQLSKKVITYIHYTFSSTFLDMTFHNLKFVRHSVIDSEPYSQTGLFTIRYSLYIWFCIQGKILWLIVIHSALHSYTWNFANQNSVNIQVHIPMHKISQLDIHYTFSSTYFNKVLHN